MKSKVSALTPFTCDLKDKQHEELLQLVRLINRKGSKAVEELCLNGDKVLGQDQNLLRLAWQQDVIERLEYDKDQSSSG